MFRQKHKENDGRQDERLALLAARWQDVEVAANFEVAVWRRIRVENVMVHNGVGVERLLAGWLLYLLPPARFSALALVTLFFIAGGWFGSVGVKIETERRVAMQPLLNPHTIAGAYASLVTTGRTE